MREPVGSRGLGSLAAGGGPGVGWQAAEVGWGGRQWPLSDGMEPWPVHIAHLDLDHQTFTWANFRTLYPGVVMS